MVMLTMARTDRAGDGGSPSVLGVEGKAQRGAGSCRLRFGAGIDCGKRPATAVQVGGEKKKAVGPLLTHGKGA